MMKAFQIQVPGSTANLGPGFDSIGAALNLYLNLSVTTQDHWEFIHIGPNTPMDTTVEHHLIYNIAQEIAQSFDKQLIPCKVEMTSELPLARGLGSSAAAIVAAIELANQVCDLQLSTKQKLSIASRIEGHPDNATASILGGITISSMIDGEADTIAIHDIDVNLVVIIPPYELKTADARSVLPESYTRSYSVAASANANMLVAHLLNKNFEKVGYYMEQDLFHEPYRAELVADFQVIKKYAKDFGAYGTALSGAGPTMISFVPSSIAATFVASMKEQFETYAIVLTKIDNKGIQVVEKRDFAQERL
jgi:homoserine kinase